MAWDDGLSDAQVLEYARQRGVVKPSEDPLASMSDAELRRLAVERGIVPKIGLGEAATLGAADAVTFNTTDELAARTKGVFSGLSNAAKLARARKTPTAPASVATAASGGNWRAILAALGPKKPGAPDPLATPAGSSVMRQADAGTKAISDMAPGVEDQTLQDIRRDQTRAREERPLTYYGSGIAAGLATPGTGVNAVKSVGNAAKAALAVRSPAAIKALSVLAKTALKGAAGGLAYGTAAGLGDAEGDIADRVDVAASPDAMARNATLGAGGALAFSGTLGLAQLAARGGGWAARRLARALQDNAAREGQATSDATTKISGQIELPPFGAVSQETNAAALARAKAAAEAKGGEFFDSLNIPYTRGQAAGDEGEMAWERLAASGMFGDEVQKAIAPKFRDQAEAFIEEAPRVVAPSGELKTMREIDAAANVLSGVRDEFGKLKTERNQAYDDFTNLRTPLLKKAAADLSNMARGALIKASGLPAKHFDLAYPPETYKDTYKALGIIDRLVSTMKEDPSARTLQTLEPTRQVLVNLLDNAVTNNTSDVRGLTILKQVFDDWERGALTTAGRRLTQKGQQDLPAILSARASHGRMAQFENDAALRHIVMDPKATEASILDKLFGAGGVDAKTGSVPAIRAIKEASYRRAYIESGGELPAEHINPRDLAAFSEPWQSLREAVMHRLIGTAERDLERAGTQGMPWARIAKGLDSALNGAGSPITRELYTPEEIALLQRYQQAAERFAIKANGQNSSGTALAAARAMGPLVDRLLTAVGSVRVLPFAAEASTHVRTQLQLAKARRAVSAPAAAQGPGLGEKLRGVLLEAFDAMQPRNADSWPEAAGAINARNNQDTKDERDARIERDYAQ